MPTYKNKSVALVVDVRSKLEYWLGHLPGAICLPAQSIAESLPIQAGITKDSRILLYCASGARSAIAASTLSALGYRHVIDGGPISTARGLFAA
jgi:rhodanese-related sulfurtransferase